MITQQTDDTRANTLGQIIARQRAEREIQAAIDRGAAEIESVLEREFFRSYTTRH